MSRSRAGAIRIQGKLEALRPLHVGGLAGPVETDMPLARDGRGRLCIPGTSLAGALRSWMQERFDEALVDELWGSQKQDRGAASRIIVEDSALESWDEEIWDGVGIDRQWGTAAEGIKFDRAILPRGTVFPFSLRMEVSPGDEGTRHRAMLGHLVRAMLDGTGIQLGAGITRGQGRVKLLGEGVRIMEEDWSSRQGILNLLEGRISGRSPDQWIKGCPDLKPREPEIVEVSVQWRPDGPVMVKSGFNGMEADILPMISRRRADEWCRVIPGSSLKGALREHAERIVRTVLELGPAGGWKDLEGRDRHLRQLDVPLVNRLFGSAKKKEDGGSRGCLEVAPCYLPRPAADRQTWENLARAGGDEALQKAMEALPGLDRAYHVAVDRWTGGAADQMLYSAIEPFSPETDPLRMTIHLKRIGDQREAALALILLLLQDLCRGRIRIGFGTNRGYGRIQVLSVDMDGPGFKWRISEQGVLEGADLPRLRAAWESWIQRGGR